MMDIDIEEVLQRAIEVTDFVDKFSIPSKFKASERDGPTEILDLQGYTSIALPMKTKMEMFDILKENMQDLYSSIPSWGWQDHEKQKELFHPHSRYLILFTSEGKIAAFSMFRFEWDDEDEPEHPVLYCYELQVASPYRRKGLGQHISQCLIKIAEQLNLWKVLLTCFKKNSSALLFYESIGFSIDINSPSRCGYTNEPYEILSNKPNLK